MKKVKTLKAALAAILAALMALAAFPVSAIPLNAAEKTEITPYWTVPEGYDEHDYNAIVSFLEIEDENGVKNGEKLSLVYDPNDPVTWSGENAGVIGFDVPYEDDSSDWMTFSGRLTALMIDNLDMVGELRLNGCERVELVNCFGNRLTKIDLTGTRISVSIGSEGNGYVGFGMLNDGSFCVHAQAIHTVGFSGFFDEYGEELPAIDESEYIHRVEFSILDDSYDEYADYDIIASFPVAEAASGRSWWVPFGYDRNDYERIAEFLEQKDSNGVRNGEKLNSAYNPSFPDTWLVEKEGYASDYNRQIVFWNDVQNGGWDDELQAYSEKTLQYITLYNAPYNVKLVGTLDASNCRGLEKIYCQKQELDALIVDGCTNLKGIYCFDNNIGELDVSGNEHLEELICYSNRISSLELSANAALTWLDCYDNELSGLDVSNNPNLDELLCEDIRVGELELHSNPNLPYGLVKAEGPGSIGYANGRRVSGISLGSCEARTITYLYAYPQEGAVFTGFFREDGSLLSEGTWKEEYQAYTYFIPSSTTGSENVIARFSGYEDEPIPGDVDGDGEVTALDALSIMRLLVSETDGSDMNVDAADMNGDGVVDILDALLALRMAIGAV